MPEDLIINTLSDVGVWRELTLLLSSFMKRWLQRVNREAVNQEAVNHVAINREGGGNGGRCNGT
jgi:hypothetical protein